MIDFVRSGTDKILPYPISISVFDFNEFDIPGKRLASNLGYIQRN